MSDPVTLRFLFDDREVTVTVPRGITGEEVRRVWQQLTDRIANQHRFTVSFLNGLELAFGPISQLESPDVRTITIHADRLYHLELMVIGVRGRSVYVVAHSRTTPFGLVTEARSQLDLSEDRAVRIKIGERFLAMDAPLLTQMEPTTPLFIDLEVKVLVMPMTAYQFSESEMNYGDQFAPAIFSSEQNMLVSCFASESCQVILQRNQGWTDKDDDDEVFVDLFEEMLHKTLDIEEERNHRILTFEDRRHISWLSPISKLSPNILDVSCIAVWLETVMQAHIDNRIIGKQETLQFWPSSKLGVLLTAPNQSVLIDGKKADAEKSLWEAGVQDGAVLTVTEFTIIRVIDSSGQLHELNIDLHQQALDLHYHVSQFEAPNLHFLMFFDGRCLSRETRSLSQLGVKAFSKVFLSFRMRTVVLRKEGKQPVMVHDVKEGTSFSNFLSSASEALKERLPQDTRFLCACGRVFSDECQQRRSFPIRCCEDPVLSLVVMVPVTQHFRGRWSSCQFRLPSGRITRVFNQLSRLATADRGKEWQETEAALIRAILALQAASQVRIELDQRLDLLLQLPNNFCMPWSVRPDDSVRDSLTEIESLTFQPVSDVAVRGNRCLNVREKPMMTFTDFGLRSGIKIHPVRPTTGGECKRLCN